MVAQDGWRSYAKQIEMGAVGSFWAIGGAEQVSSLF